MVFLRLIVLSCVLGTLGSAHQFECNEMRDAGIHGIVKRELPPPFNLFPNPIKFHHNMMEAIAGKTNVTIAMGVAFALCEANLTIARTRIAALNVSLMACEANVLLLNGQANFLNGNLTQCRTNVATLTLQLIALNTTAVQCQSTVTVLTTQLAAQNTTLVQCQANLTTVGLQLASLQSSLNQCQANTTLLSSQLDTVRNSLLQCQNSTAVLTTQVATLQASLTQCQTNTSTLGAQLTALQNTVTQCQANVSALTLQVSTLQMNLAQCQANVTVLNNQITALTLQNTNLQTRINSIVATCTTRLAGITLTKLANGQNYFFYTDATGRRTWFGAKDFCHARGMELVTIESQAENDLIVARLSTIFAGETGINAFFWIGLNDLETPLVFKWSGTGTFVSYADWHVGQPDNAGGTELCGDIYSSAGVIKWNDRSCTGYTGRFICELPSPCNELL